MNMFMAAYAALLSNEEWKHRVNSGKPSGKTNGNPEPNLANEVKVAKKVQRLGVRTQPIHSISALLQTETVWMKR